MWQGFPRRKSKSLPDVAASRIGFSHRSSRLVNVLRMELAVTGARRLGSLPDVPTMKEVYGEDLFVQESWGGLWVPAGTPPAIVARLHAATKQAFADPELRAAIARLLEDFRWGRMDEIFLGREAGVRGRAPSLSPRQ